MTCFGEEPDHTPDKDDYEAWEKFEAWKEIIKPQLHDFNTWQLLRLAFDAGWKAGRQ